MTISAEQAAKLLECTTPGPWYRDAWDIRAPSPGTGAVCEVASPNGDDNQYWRDGESDANARLIAAAPDLARALIASEAARKLAEERLARAVEALKPFAHCAKDRDVDDPAWKDHISIGIGVTIGELRAVLSIPKEIDNG